MHVLCQSKMRVILEGVIGIWSEFGIFWGALAGFRPKSGWDLTFKTRAARKSKGNLPGTVPAKGGLQIVKILSLEPAHEKSCALC